VGYIRPYQDTRLTDLQKLQDTCPAYSVALHCARSAIADRILAIETWIHTTHKNLLFSGELDILSQAADELENLVRIEELRRIDRLVSDMYYEIFSRLFDPVYGFRRRTDRPYRDPMNAILSYGYGMLAASCTRSLVGAFLNPDGGMLNRGEQSLTLDLINCWKTGMIDLVVLSLAESGCIRSAGYECSSGRCIISEGLINTLISSFQESIQKEVIDLQVQGLVKFLKGEAPFEMYRYRGLL
jgi:CRISPR-associated endonuclease Cas1